MLKIDNSLLEEIGLAALPDLDKNSLLKHIYETLEMRVGMRLANQMTNEQLDEFEKYFEAKDDAGAFKWLESNFPNYKDIVQEEFDKLRAEVAESAPHILAAAQQAALDGSPVATTGVPEQQFATPAPAAPIDNQFADTTQPVYDAYAQQPPLPQQQAPVYQQAPAPVQPYTPDPQQYQAPAPQPQYQQPQYQPPQPIAPAPQAPQGYVADAPAYQPPAPTMPTADPVASAQPQQYQPPAPTPPPADFAYPSQQPPAGPGQ